LPHVIRHVTELIHAALHSVVQSRQLLRVLRVLRRGDECENHAGKGECDLTTKLDPNGDLEAAMLAALDNEAADKDRRDQNHAKIDNSNNEGCCQLIFALRCCRSLTHLVDRCELLIAGAGPLGYGAVKEVVKQVLLDANVRHVLSVFLQSLELRQDTRARLQIELANLIGAKLAVAWVDSGHILKIDLALSIPLVPLERI